MMMAHAGVDIEDQVSATGNGEVFDSGSNEADSGLNPAGIFPGDGMVLMGEGDSRHDAILKCFLSGMFKFADRTEVVAVHEMSPTAEITKAKFLAFSVYAEAVAKKNGGDANVGYAWYGGSKEEIRGIMTFGFRVSGGFGIHLAPYNFSAAGVLSTKADEDGLRHVLLCRVILGKSEVIRLGSKQTHPSSTEFDTGVDNLQNPKKYIIWNSSMNNLVLPICIVSFKAAYLKGTSVKPSSLRIGFPVLIAVISKLLKPSKMVSIYKSYGDFREGKIRREQFVRGLREVAGDEVLARIIKQFSDKNKEKLARVMA